VQCKKYRNQFTEEKKTVYEEKLEASELFRGKKALYPSRYLKFNFHSRSLFHPVQYIKATSIYVLMSY